MCACQAKNNKFYDTHVRRPWEDNLEQIFISMLFIKFFLADLFFAVFYFLKYCYEDEHHLKTTDDKLVNFLILHPRN